MKKDIPRHKVEDLAIAIAPGDDPDLWDVYILNLKDEAIQNVLVASNGYGQVDGEAVKTSILRHFFEEIGPLGVHKIEPIQSSLFHLTHEFWVSFTFEDYMYDKKYVFVQGSIHEMNFTPIPFVGRQGVMIR